MIIIIIVSMPDPQGLSQLSQISMQPSSSSLFPQQDQCMSFHYKGLLMLMTSLVLTTTMLLTMVNKQNVVDNSNIVRRNGNI